jgi:hypothetical protein
MNATMGYLQFHVTVVPLQAFVRERSSSNPSIILGVTLSSSITTFVLLVLAAIFFRNYHIMKAKRILVLEREKWVAKVEQWLHYLEVHCVDNVLCSGPSSRKLPKPHTRTHSDTLATSFATRFTQYPHLPRFWLSASLQATKVTKTSRASW